jgi:LPXTG-motif cell wall-anchored protein
MANVTRSSGRRVCRSLTAAVLCAATLTLLAVPASAQGIRSRGVFFVYQSTDCSLPIERATDPTVSTPFSIGGRNYPANIAMELFATDLNTNPNETFGPFVVTTDAEGRFCQRVNQARPTHWKIDLVEPPPGETDSKVITVELPEPVQPLPTTTTTTLPAGPTSTTLPGTTTTTTSTTVPTTTMPGQTTTAPTTTTTTSTTLPPSTTTTASTTTTTVPTTTVPGQTTTTAALGQTTTTVSGQTTTTLPGQTTTTAATTTAAPTTTVPGQTTTTALPGATTSVPEQDLGFEIEPVPVPPEGILPATGATATSELTAIAMALLATGAATYFFTVRRRRTG